MKKRYLVLTLSLVFALALAVPALGGPTNPVASISASVKSIANKALKKAKAAQTTANSALNTANEANGTAASALKEAKAATTKANTAQSTANTAKTTAEQAKALAATKLATTEFVSSAPSATNTTTFKLVGSNCPSGSVATGGGYEVGPSAAEASKVTVTSEQSAIYGPGWLVSANAISGMTPNWNLKAIAVCAHP